MFGVTSGRWSRLRFDRESEALLPELYRYARGLTRDQSAAEDLVHDTYVRAVAAYSQAKLPSAAAFRGWMKRILLNCFRDRYRRQQRAPDVLLDSHDAYNNIVSIMPSNEVQPELRAIDRDFAEGAKDAIGALPEEVRLVVVMFLLEDQSYQTIADTLEIPLGTVMSRLHRGRKLLRGALQHHMTLSAQRGTSKTSTEGCG